MNMTGWGLINVNGTAEVVTMDDLVVADIENGTALEGTTLYWVAPEMYLGNRVCLSGFVLRVCMKCLLITSYGCTVDVYFPADIIRWRDSLHSW